MNSYLGIIQARVSSSRLPSKVLLDLCAMPMIAFQIKRLKRSQKLERLIVAIPEGPMDDPLEKVIRGCGVECVRGSSDDVLDRFYQASKKFPTTHIVRMTADCPLIDPVILDEMIECEEKNHFDYLSNGNGVTPTFPDGLDIEIFTSKVLRDAAEHANKKSQREHVTPYFYQNPEKFKIGTYSNDTDLSFHRWTVDENLDYLLIQKITGALYPVNPEFEMNDVLDLLSRNPDWTKEVYKIKRNEGYDRSLEQDHGKIVCTIEARMASSRLPGKVLFLACGKPMLLHMIERLRRSQMIDEIVIATSVSSNDDAIVKFAQDHSIACYRGSEEDVLQRVLGAAKEFGAEIVVETTGDCPLIDPEILDQVVRRYLAGDCDYCSNNQTPSYPDGMDVRVFSLKTLDKSERHATETLDREHVTRHIIYHPELFRQVIVHAPEELKWPELGLTLDEEADYQLLKNIIEYFDNLGRDFSCSDIVNLLRNEKKDWLALNQSVKRKGLDA